MREKIKKKKKIAKAKKKEQKMKQTSGKSKQQSLRKPSPPPKPKAINPYLKKEIKQGKQVQKVEQKFEPKMSDKTKLKKPQKPCSVTINSGETKLNLGREVKVSDHDINL